jgi:hypothetical protein
MGKLGATSMAAALCLGLTLSAARADDGDSGDLRSMPPVKPSWWSGMFATKEPAAAGRKGVQVEGPPPPRIVASNPGQVLVREQNAYIRRLEVCDALDDVAEKKGDDALRERVNELRDKAWTVYQQRTAGNGARMADESALMRPARAPSDPARQAAVKDAVPSTERGE